MLLASITAKVLALVEGILDNFVTGGASPTALTTFNVCTVAGSSQIPVYNVSLTDCGTVLVGQIGALVSLGIGLINGLLPGLLAVSN